MGGGGANVDASVPDGRGSPYPSGVCVRRPGGDAASMSSGADSVFEADGEFDEYYYYEVGGDELD